MTEGSSNSLSGNKQPLNTILKSLFLLTFVFLLNFSARIVFGPLLPGIESDLALSHADSGSLFLSLSIGYCLAVFGSPFLSSRITHRLTVVLSTVATGVILCLTTLAQTFEHLRICLFLLGLGGGLYLPSGLASISRIVPSAYWGRAFAFHELAPNIGFVTVPLVAALLTGMLHWSDVVRLLGASLVLVGILFAAAFDRTPTFGSKLSLSLCRETMSLVEFWLMVALFGMAISSTLGLFTMLPLYLVIDRGYSQVDANHLVAFSRIISISMPFVGGWLGDKIGNRLISGTVLLAAGALTIPIGLSSDTLLKLLIVIQPAVAVCFFPCGFAILSRIGAATKGNIAVSLCIPFAFVIGSGLLPFLIGVIGDTYSLGAGIVCNGALMLGVAVGAFFIPRPDERS